MFLDYLTCGTCAQEFPLNHITDFIQHKSSSCQPPQLENGCGTESDYSEPTLLCCICSCDFHTARGVLQHVQVVHNLKIFIQKAPLSVSCPNLVGKDIANTCTSSDDRSLVPGLTIDPLSPNPNAVTTVSQDQPAAFTDSLSEDVSSSTQSNVLLTCSSPVSCPEKSIPCCGGQECCAVCGMEGEQVPLKKCCSSVVPKKRKRHMKEHDTEAAELAYQEQTALEALATLRSKVLRNQQLSSGKGEAADGETGCKPEYTSCHLEANSKGNQNGANAGENVLEENSNKFCDGVCWDPGKLKEEYKLLKCEDSHNKVTGKQKGMPKTRFTSVGRSEKVSTVEDAVLLTEEKDNVNATVPMGDEADLLKADAELAKVSGQHILLCNKNVCVPFLQKPQSDLKQIAEIPPGDYVLEPPEGMKGQAEYVSRQNVGLSISAQINLQTSSHTSVGNADINISSVFGYEKSSQALSCNQSASNVPSRLFDCLEGAVPATGDGQHVQDLPASTGDGQRVHNSPASYISCGSRGPGTATLGGGSLFVRDVDSLGGGKKRRQYPTSRPFKCEECDKAFNQRIHLKKHMSKHTGVKPFKCGVCTYSTVERSHLRAHNRIHTGEKPYSCDYCSYATAQNSTLKIHLKRHHTNKHETLTAAGIEKSAQE